MPLVPKGAQREPSPLCPRPPKRELNGFAVPFRSLGRSFPQAASQTFSGSFLPTIPLCTTAAGVRTQMVHAFAEALALPRNGLGRSFSASGNRCIPPCKLGVLLWAL